MSKIESVSKQENRKEQITVNQHYIQKAYLDLFSNNGVLYCYDIHKKDGFTEKSTNVGYVKYYYESKRHELNELEKKLARIESECFPSVRKVVDGLELITSDDVFKVLKYTSVTNIRSPAFRSSIWDRCISQGRFLGNTLEEEVREQHYKMIRFAEYGIFGKPFSCFQSHCIRFSEDVLVTSDCPVMVCNLYEIVKGHYNTGEDLEGHIFPLSPRVLFLIVDRNYQKEYMDLFGDGSDKVNPMMVNRIMAETATQYLFARDPNNPIFANIDNIDRNLATIDTYTDFDRDRRRSKNYLG